MSPAPPAILIGLPGLLVEVMIGVTVAVPEPAAGACPEHAAWMQPVGPAPVLATEAGLPLGVIAMATACSRVILYLVTRTTFRPMSCAVASAICMMPLGPAPLSASGS